MPKYKDVEDWEFETGLGNYANLLINGEVVIKDGSYNSKLAGIPIRMNKK